MAADTMDAEAWVVRQGTERRGVPRRGHPVAASWGAPMASRSVPDAMVAAARHVVSGPTAAAVWERSVAPLQCAGASAGGPRDPAVSAMRQGPHPMELARWRARATSPAGRVPRRARVPPAPGPQPRQARFRSALLLAVLLAFRRPPARPGPVPRPAAAPASGLARPLRLPAAAPVRRGWPDQLSGTRMAGRARIRVPAWTASSRRRDGGSSPAVEVAARARRAWPAPASWSGPASCPSSARAFRRRYRRLAG